MLICKNNISQELQAEYFEFTLLVANLKHLAKTPNPGLMVYHPKKTLLSVAFFAVQKACRCASKRHRGPGQ